MNLFLLLEAEGLSHSLFGQRLIPVGTPLIGMSQDGLAAFEPAYVDELFVIMERAFKYLQKDGEGDPDERTWLRDEIGGSVYLRLSTRNLKPGKPPGRSVQAKYHWRGNLTAQSHVEKLLAQVPGHGGIVSAIDGHPATLGWLGSVAGHRKIPLGVEHFGQTGTVGDLYRHHGIDAATFAQSAEGLKAGSISAAKKPVLGKNSDFKKLAPCSRAKNRPEFQNRCLFQQRLGLCRGQKLWPRTA